MQDWKIWFKKLGKGVLATGISSGLIYTAGYLNLTEFPPEYAMWGGLAVVICSQIGNFVKHAYLE